MRPEDITFMDIKSDSVIIQWTVPYISYSPETYVVQYGTSRDSLIHNSSSTHRGPCLPSLPTEPSLTLVGWLPAPSHPLQTPNHGPGSSRMTQSAECCRRYNDGKCKQSPNTCRYSHRCMECGGPHPWLQCPRGGHRGSYARSRSPISLGRLAQPPGAPGHLRRLRPVGHGLESDGSRSSGTPPPQNCPSRSMSCYPFCWLIFSGVVRGETTRW